ncbi:hypothetical protein [Phenylobacterium soli]|uniref:Uncharacterized protein n=1 Tax=Phenylobacterium soli TaxID=2170551 RepID=A0A328AG80_9CAUL|nr:hypothetical protein [Phenylobacterium soli]RAK53545.1 hypothetical protein DJ017_02880 [Phenylobacterium soli]
MNDLIPPDAEHPNVLHALIGKRAEIAGRIEHTQLQLRHLITELDHLDATIRVFDPTVDVGDIRSKPVPPRHAAFKGEVTRIVFRTLRSADGPVTSRDIARRLMTERGLNPEDRELSIIMVKRVCACLRVQRHRGLVRNAPAEGSLQGWTLATGAEVIRLDDRHG